MKKYYQRKATKTKEKICTENARYTYLALDMY